MTEITFGEIVISQLFQVKDIRRNILPDRENYTYDVPNKHGSYYGGYRYTSRIIEVDYMMDNMILTKTRELAYLLDIDNPTELRFSDEPDKYYYAVLDGSTSISKILEHAEGTLSFICFDPFAYSDTPKEFIADDQLRMFIDNEGTAPTAPRFEIDIAGDTGYLAIVSPNGIVQVGTPKEVDGINLPKSETLISNPMENTNNLVVNTSGKVRTAGASIMGTIKTIGTPAYGITPNSYGTSSDWHGMTVRQALPPSKDGTGTAENFQVTFTFEFGTYDAYVTGGQKQMGRVEHNVMDENNNFLMGFTMRDSTQGYEMSIPEFFVGNTRIWTEVPSIPPKKKVKQYDKKKKKYVTKYVTNTEAGKWNEFYGKIIMRRTGNTFYFELQKIKDGKIVRRVTKTWRDSNNFYAGKKAKTLNSWFGQAGTSRPIGKNSLNHITFRKDNTSNWHELPNLMTTGDKLIIDCEENAVYLNEALFMERLDIGSEFFEVDSGESEIRILCSDYGEIAGAKAIITEKYL